MRAGPFLDKEQLKSPYSGNHESNLLSQHQWPLFTEFLQLDDTIPIPVQTSTCLFPQTVLLLSVLFHRWSCKLLNSRAHTYKKKKPTALDPIFAFPRGRSDPGCGSSYQPKPKVEIKSQSPQNNLSKGTHSSGTLVMEASDAGKQPFFFVVLTPPALLILWAVPFRKLY